MAEFFYAGRTFTEELRNIKSNQNIRGSHLVRLILSLPRKMGPERPTFYLIAYMGEFLYAENNTYKELRNAKSHQNIRDYTPGQTSPFLPGKIWPKRTTFYLIAYMAEFLYAKNNTNEEQRNVKSNQKDLYFTPSLIWLNFGILVGIWNKS